MTNIIPIAGAEAWTDAYDLGKLLAKRFPHDAVDDLCQAYRFNGMNLEDLAAATSIDCTRFGQNDGADWHWTVVTGGRTWLIVAGCDYTGWDCQSWLTATEVPND